MSVNAVTIQLPPLRERPADIPLLIQHFLGQAKREFNKPDLEGASPETVELLTSYSWPGNVRQLRAVIRRCVLDSVLPVIVPSVLPAEVHADSAAKITAATSAQGEADQFEEKPEQDEMGPDGRELPELVDRLLEQKSTDLYAEAISYAERYLLVRVLRQTEGNQTKAAEILGITRGKLRDRIATYNIRLESGIRIDD